MRIATWNVNSLRARLTNVTHWLKKEQPDIVMLQELKCTNEQCPIMELEECGYNIAVSGQKAWNGVAILAKERIEDVQTHIPHHQDDQARYIEALIGGKIKVASIYAPNGNPIGTEKFTYKLTWMDHFIHHVEKLLQEETPLVLGGDYNIAPTDKEVYSIKAFKDDAIAQPESRKKWQTLMHLGLTDALRVFEKGDVYTYWSYRGGCWPKNYGVLIDFLLLSPKAADHLKAAGIDLKPRGETKASDHTPLWCELKF